MENNIHNTVDQIYCINMPINNDRRKFIQYQSDLYNLDIKFYNAIDFAQFFNINKSDYLYFILNIFKYNEWKSASAQFGCLFSHYSVIKNAYLLGLNKIIIIEDDICFYKNINVFFNILSKIPDNADFIKFEPIQEYLFIKLNESPYDTYYKNIYNEIKNDMNNNDYIKFNNYYKYKLNNLYNMGFYYMNRKMMEKFINFIENTNIFPKIADNLLWIVNEDINFYYSSISLGIQYKMLDCSPNIIISKNFNKENYNVPNIKLEQNINYYTYKEY